MGRWVCVVAVLTCLACDEGEEGTIGGPPLGDDTGVIDPQDVGEQGDAAEPTDATSPDSDAGASADAGDAPDGGGPIMAGPCIETVMVGDVEIFVYEASRVDATAEGAGFDESAGVCSQGGVLPWTGLTWPDANRVCLDAGFRLCSNDEWQAACQGDRGWAFPYGTDHRPGRCNDHVSGSGMVEPTGGHPDCVTPEGLHDMSGNVWELTSDSARRGASWKVNAVMFRPDSARCDVAYDIIEGFADDDVGFRCCR